MLKEMKEKLEVLIKRVYCPEFRQPAEMKIIYRLLPGMSDKVLGPKTCSLQTERWSQGKGCGESCVDLLKDLPEKYPS